MYDRLVPVYFHSMAQRLADRLLTFADYEKLPDDPRYCDELSRGRLVREPRPGHVHGRVQLAVGSLMRAWVVEHQLGYVVGESGFKLEYDPDTLRGPDVAFVSRARYGSEPPQKWADFPPDLAVEILSPSNTVAGMAEKVTQYFGAGTRLVWLIDPHERVAIVYHAAGDAHVLHEQDELDGEDVLPGFRCSLKDILD